MQVCRLWAQSPIFDVTFAYINFRLKGFPVSDFQYGDGYTDYGVTLIHVKHQLVFNYNDRLPLLIVLSMLVVL